MHSNADEFPDEEWDEPLIFFLNGVPYRTLTLAEYGIRGDSLVKAEDATPGDVVIISNKKYCLYNKEYVENHPLKDRQGFCALAVREYDRTPDALAVPASSPWYKLKGTVFLE